MSFYHTHTCGGGAKESCRRLPMTIGHSTVRSGEYLTEKHT